MLRLWRLFGQEKLKKFHDREGMEGNENLKANYIIELAGNPRTHLKAIEKFNEFLEDKTIPLQNRQARAIEIYDLVKTKAFESPQYKDLQRALYKKLTDKKIITLPPSEAAIKERNNIFSIKSNIELAILAYVNDRIVEQTLSARHETLPENITIDANKPQEKTRLKAVEKSVMDELYGDWNALHNDVAQNAGKFNRHMQQTPATKNVINLICVYFQTNKNLQTIINDILTVFPKQIRAATTEKDKSGLLRLQEMLVNAQEHLIKMDGKREPNPVKNYKMPGLR